MSTEADLCSAALVKLGAAPITSLNDSTTESLIASRLYPVARDALLSCHPWDFTIAEAQLTQDPSVSVENGYAFVLPTDLLRTISAGPGTLSRGWSIASSAIGYEPPPIP
ncbi:hypothetical protein SAMN07250955_105229 [Arboricoccus pini]|uniref:Uncharacterized protein n=1 Tax=Arboricoccus pini TaxID=1963835 RepID=A0A212R4Z2_9PROT|nr:hypothetical protein [Arboricoccus pini]SNB66981.1 hypothetical protein SAMN07250955_105229 [Arboricoccus pini]